MGSSLILTGGAAVTKTLKEAITQTAHGFTVGDVIRWNPTSSPPKYVLSHRLIPPPMQRWLAWSAAVLTPTTLR